MRHLTLDEVINENLKDPKFREAWEESEARYQATRSLIRARLEEDLTQKELANKAGTTQAVISRIENMSVNPSIGLLDRLARGMGRELRVELI